MSGYDDMTELDWMMLDRQQHGLVPVGPLTADQQESMDAYDRYNEEQFAEHEAQEAAGGRTICEECGLRLVVHRTVCTYGYPGHPGADYSDYGRCEGCGHEEF